MTNLVASRFEIDFALLELDEGGEPVNEYRQAPVILFGLAAVRRWLEELPAQIDDAEARLDLQKGGPNGDDPEIRPAVSRGN